MRRAREGHVSEPGATPVTNHVRRDATATLCGVAPTTTDIPLRDAQRWYGDGHLGRELHCSACFDRLASVQRRRTRAA